MLDVRLKALDVFIKRAYPEESLMAKHEMNPRRVKRNKKLYSRWEETTEVLSMQELLVRLTDARARKGQYPSTESDEAGTAALGARVTPEGQSSDDMGSNSPGKVADDTEAKNGKATKNAQEKNLSGKDDSVENSGASTDRSERSVTDSTTSKTSSVAPDKSKTSEGAATNKASATKPNKKNQAGKNVNKGAAPKKANKNAEKGKNSEKSKSKSPKLEPVPEQSEAAGTGQSVAEEAEVLNIKSLLEVSEMLTAEQSDETLLVEMGLYRAARIESQALRSHSETCLKLASCTENHENNTLWKTAALAIARQRRLQKRLDYLKVHAPKMAVKMEKQTEAAKANMKEQIKTKTNQNGMVLHPEDFHIFLEQEFAALQAAREDGNSNNKNSIGSNSKHPLPLPPINSTNNNIIARPLTAQINRVTAFSVEDLNSRHVGEMAHYLAKEEPPLPPISRRVKRQPSNAAKVVVSDAMRGRIADVEDIYGSDFLQKLRDNLKSRIDQIKADMLEP